MPGRRARMAARRTLGTRQHWIAALIGALSLGLSSADFGIQLLPNVDVNQIKQSIEHETKAVEEGLEQSVAAVAPPAEAQAAVEALPVAPPALPTAPPMEPPALPEVKQPEDKPTGLAALVNQVASQDVVKAVGKQLEEIPVTQQLEKETEKVLGDAGKAAGDAVAHPDEVVEKLKEKAPEAAAALNQTGTEVAAAIEGAASGAAEAIEHADGKHKELGSELAEVQSRGSWVKLLTVCLLATGAFGGFQAYMKVSTRSVKPSDEDYGVQMLGTDGKDETVKRYEYEEQGYYTQF